MREQPSKKLDADVYAEAYQGNELVVDRMFFLIETELYDEESGTVAVRELDLRIQKEDEAEALIDAQ